MKKVSLLLFVTLILLLAFAACTANKHEHEFADATCESPAKCSCGVTQGEALGHDMTAATCTAPATCNVCGAVDGAALGHSWRDATCTAPKTCLTCNETEGTPAAHKNDIVLEAKDPTCSATGLTAGVKCSACNTITTEQEVVSKLPHTEAILEAKESTCSEAGLTEGKECSVCHEILVAQQPTDKKAHTEEVLEAKESTCSAKGLTEGLWCTVCKEILVAQEETDKKPHTIETITGTPATCTQNGLTDGSWCTVCETIQVPQTVIEAAHKNVVDKEYQAPTCTEDGHEAGKYCEECNTVIEGMETLKAPGHDLNDGDVNNWKAPTCQAPGYYDWVISCYDCDYEEFTHITIDSETNPGEKNLAQLNHVFTNYVYNNDATCYADGTKTAVCNLCKASAEPATDTVTAAGTQREHKEPTTVACGAHWECEYDDCDYVSPEALEHQMSKKTCTEYAKCTRDNGCGYVDVDGGYADHTKGEATIKNDVKPTCLDAGSYDEVYYCTVCKTYEIETVEVTVDALGHDMADATCYAPSTCTRCGHKEGDVRASHKLEMSYDDGVLAYTCVTCLNNSFTVDTQKFVVTGDKNDTKVISMIDQNGKYAGYNTPVDGAYQFIQSETAAGRMQGQIWMSAYAKGLEGFSAANKGVGFYSAKLNLNFNYKDGNSEDMLSIKLVESHTANTDPDNGYHWDTPQGCIKDNLFYITNVIEDGKTVQYKITGMNSMVMYLDAEEDSNWSGWFNIAAGIELDQENDLVTVHYYINGEYWYSASAPLTTSADSLTSVYMNLNTYGAGHGYKYDDLAFGYTKNGEWTFDSCDHNLVKGATTAATCTADGYTIYTCDKAGCKYTCKGDIVGALGHDIQNIAAQASTCVEKGWNAYSYCARCEDAAAAKEAALLDLVAHTLGGATVKNLVAAQCEIDGSYDNYYYCTVCGTYEFEDAREVGIKIDATGHTDEVVPGKAADCTNAGLKDGTKCSVCGKTTLEQEVIPALGHTKETVPGYAATCTKTGLTDGEKCSVCQVTLVAQAEIPVVAHTYGDDRICDVCGYETACEHPEDKYVTIPAVDATCTATGLTAGIKCGDCGEIVKAPETVQALGHTEETLAAKAATCTETGLTAGKKCSVCQVILEAQTEIAAKGHTEVVDQAKAPTCTETGLEAGKHCSVCGEVTVAQVVIPANGHNMAAATCYVPATCTVCGHKEGEAIANHTINATYKNSVLTFACATCSDVFTPENKVVYDGENTKYSITIQNAKSEPNKGTLTVEDGAYKLESTVDERIQYLWFLPSNSKASTFKGFNAENNAFGIVSFEMTTDATEAFRFIVMEPRYDGSTNLWANDRGWDDNSMDILAVTPVTENGKITKYNISGQSFTNATIATVGVDANGMSEKISVQMVMKLTDDMQFMISYYVNGAFYGVYTRDLVNTPVNNKGTMLQRINEGLIEAIYICGNTTGNGTGFILDNLYLGYTANAEWMFDACDHVYGDTTTVAPDCTNKGYDESVCTLCGFAKRENVKAALGHTATPSCMEAVNCTVCGEKAYDALNHNVITTYTDKLVYSCSRCDDYSVAIEDGYFNDGTGYNGFNTGITNNKAHGYTDRDDTLPEIVDGHYEFIKDDSYAGSGQVQIWMPKSGTHDKLQGFTPANEALGIFSMKINMNLDKGNLRVILVDINDKTANSWQSNNQINALMTFNVPSNGQIRLDVWGKNDIAKLDIGADGWTGDIDVRVVMKLTSNGNLTAMYYINGELLYTHSAACPITTGSINALYITGNSTAAGTGYVFDDLAYGYTPYGHWTLDGQEHKVTPATACNVPASCTCGWTGLGLDHDLIPATCAAPATCKDCGAQVGEKAAHNFSVIGYDKSTHNVIYSCSNDCGTGCTLTGYYYDGTDTGYSYAANGNMPLDNSKGYYEYIFTAKGEEQTAENGWAQNSNNKKWGAQTMFWIPARANNGGLDGLSAENNATGIISFRMRSNMSDAFTVAIGKERDYANWNNDGTWKLNFNIFQISAYSDAGITINNVYGGTKAIATIPAAGDGWSEWFDMDIIISLKDNGAITLDYYVNDAHVHTASGTLYTVPSTGKFVDIRAVYINGWTYTSGTGLAIDNFTFGKLHHNIFDGKEHVMSDACGAPISCSCGYVTTIDNPHNWTVATSCTDYATCTKCGAKGSALAHEVTASIVNSKPTYGCKNCATTFAPEVSVTGDGSSTDYIQSIGGTANLLTTATEDGNSYYSVIATSDTAVKEWTWLNATGDAAINRLSGFSCANNSSGVISFKLNLQGITSSLGIRPAYGRNSSQWTDIDGNGDAWNDNTFYLMTIQAASSGTTRKITSNYGTVGTVNINEWIDFVITIQLHNDGTMSLDYYINGVLALSVDKVAMMNSGKISSVEFELQNATTGNGYYLDDFAIGYSNNAHWNLDGNYHSVVEGSKATCESGIKCSCGNQIGAALGHDIGFSPSYNAATNTLVYSCERTGCTMTYEAKGYYYDGSAGSKTYAESSSAHTENAATGEYYDYSVKESWNGESYQTQMWIPGNYDNQVTALSGFSCENNATGFITFKIKLLETMADGQVVHLIVGNPRNTADWNTGTWGAHTMYMLKLTKSGNNVTIRASYGSSGEANASDVATVSIADWIEIGIKVDLSKNGDTNKISYDVYVNGQNVGSKSGTYNVTDGMLEAMYIKTEGNTSNKDFYLDDIAIAYIEKD